MTFEIREASFPIHYPSLVLFGYFLLAVLFVHPSTAVADNMDAIRFTHPSGVFSLSIPKSWGQGARFPGNPNVVIFRPPGGSEFTVSITQNLSLPPELPMEIGASMFPDETPITKPTRGRGNGWNSIRQDFERKTSGKTRVWLAAFYGFRSNTVAITLSDTKENISEFREAFERISKSIEFHEKR